MDQLLIQEYDTIKSRSWTKVTSIDETGLFPGCLLFLNPWDCYFALISLCMRSTQSKAVPQHCQHNQKSVDNKCLYWRDSLHFLYLIKKFELVHGLHTGYIQDNLRCFRYSAKTQLIIQRGEIPSVSIFFKCVTYLTGSLLWTGARRKIQVFCFSTAKTIHVSLFWEHNSDCTEPDQNFIKLLLLGKSDRHTESS